MLVCILNLLIKWCTNSLTWLLGFVQHQHLMILQYIKPQPWGLKCENIHFLPSLSPAVKSFKPFISVYIARLLINRGLYMWGRCPSTCFRMSGFNSFTANVADRRRHSRLPTSPIGDLDPSLTLFRSLCLTKICSVQNIFYCGTSNLGYLSNVIERKSRKIKILENL